MCGVCVATTSPWTIVPRFLEIDSPGVGLAGGTPFHLPNARSPARVEGQLHYRYVAFSLGAECPGFR